MIFLTKGQTLYDNPGMVTYDPTGYYEDGDSIVCASAASPEEPVCRYEAKFVAYGNMVYSIADPDALLEEVKKINPDTLFGKTNADKVASDIVNNIQMADSQNPTTETVELPTEETASSTPVLDIPSDPVVNPLDVSTTTPTLGTSDTSNASSTPSIEDIIDNVSDVSTTTPESIINTETVIATPEPVIIPEAATTTP
jgi:hypothetical protein